MILCSILSLQIQIAIVVWFTKLEWNGMEWNGMVTIKTRKCISYPPFIDVGTHFVNTLYCTLQKCKSGQEVGGHHDPLVHCQYLLGALSVVYSLPPNIAITRKRKHVAS